MAKKNIFNFIELSFTDLTNQTNTWLRNVYSKSDILFNSSSPYGQIITYLKELFRHNIIYQKRSTEQINIEQTTDQKVIWNISRIAGHNPSRPISATGTLMFKMKPGININEDTSGSIIINNDTLIKNKSNNLKYSISLGNDSNVYNLNETTQFFVNILQGEFETQTFTGTGEPIQSFSVNISSESMIDNFNVLVYVNDYPLTVKASRIDMLPNELSCVVRTGFDGGVDVEFGTDDYGFVPAIGTTIKVKYLLTEGQRGNILNPLNNDWSFIDTIRDTLGNEVDMEDIFNVTIDVSVGFSSNGESPKFTKTLIPYVSRNFILSTPPQFIFHLKRNQIYLYLIPKIDNYFTDSINYFNVPIDVFYLDDIEQSKVFDYIKKMGILSMTSEMIIVQPKIKRYVSYVYVRRYDNITETNISSEIISIMSDYLLNNERFDRIVKSDLISKLKGIDGIDSIDIHFVCKENEDYHIRNNKLIQHGLKQKSLKFSKLSKKINVLNSKDLTPVTNLVTDGEKIQSQYNKDTIIGLDPVHGDIVVNKDEYAIMRGGWKDRNDVYYNENMDINGLSSINVIFDGVTNKENK